MREGIQVGISNAASLVLTILASIGAPPSEFVPGPNIWRHLEFLMLPALFSGAGLSVIALFLTALIQFRIAAVACVAAIIVSMIGVITAWGIDAEGTTIILVKSLAVLSLPMIGAMNVIMRLGKSDGKSKCEE